MHQNKFEERQTKSYFCSNCITIFGGRKKEKKYLIMSAHESDYQKNSLKREEEEKMIMWR